MINPKILFLDIETKPIEAYVWGLYNQNISLDYIKKDWSILAWAAKWHGSDKMMYMDNRKKTNLMDDKAIVKGIAKLINEADWVVGQNIKKFDIRKINARAAINRLPALKRPSKVDILTENRKIFAFTSHKLSYTTEKLNTTYKKLTHPKYPGFTLWKEVMNGNQHAWKEMETYCKHDVLSTEEEFTVVRPWIKTPSMAVFNPTGCISCLCGSSRLRRKGYAFTEKGRFQQYLCLNCGKWPRSSINLMPKQEKNSYLQETK